MFLPMIAGAGLGAGLSSAGVLGATSAAMVGLGAMSTLSAGMSSYQQSEFNADVAKKQAEQKRQANEYNETLQRRRVERLLSMQKVAAAGSGIAYEGSPLAVSLDTAYQYEIDKGLRKYNSEVEATKLENESELSMMYGRSQLLNSLLSAGVQAYDRVDRYAQ
jgi:predicted lipid-binding transport protein (Tim44 family)